MKSILLVSHGSRNQETTDEVETLVSRLRSKTGIYIFEYAFLEVSSPDILTGIENCIQKGATEVLVLLNFLNSGRHVKNDIPSIVLEAQNKYPKHKISISRPVGQHPRIDELFIDLIK